MPKRSTHTYSSEDAPGNLTEQKLYVYYCAFSGAHAMISDVPLDKVPRRKTDNAHVIDTRKHQVRLSGKDGGVKILKRDDGKCERQFRVHQGDLPVAYRSEENGRYLYIIDGALSSYSKGKRKGGNNDTPIPPCVTQLNNGKVQLAVKIDEKAAKFAVLSLSADHILIQIPGIITGSGDKIVEFFARTLGVRMIKLTLLRGWSNRSKLIVVDDETAMGVYKKLMEAVDSDEANNPKKWSVAANRTDPDPAPPPPGFTVEEP